LILHANMAWSIVGCQPKPDFSAGGSVAPVSS
jgi:hypothetical protein